MNVDDFTFHLPEELIAAHPAERRDGSRLLVVRPGCRLEHRRFPDVSEYLRPGDLLVMNNSRVIPARLFARRTSGGGTEILLLRNEGGDQWRVLARPAKKVRAGARLIVEPGVLEAVVEAEHEAGERSLRFECQGDFRALLERFGELPLPPYIRKRRAAAAECLYIDEDRERYQTVYARPEGSIAAPTAGLHFTPGLMEELRARGVETAFVTLHVGAGTFQVMEEGGRVEEHVMHFEEYEVSEAAARAVTEARRAGRRIVAVGTTSVRTLESAARGGELVAGRAQTNLMIAPGHQFQVVGAMITNFHLPRSTLLLLVSAFAGRECILHAYETAIAERYRFFSYGDAMMLAGKESRA